MRAVLILGLKVHLALRASALVTLWIGWVRMYLRAHAQPVELPATVISDWEIATDAEMDAGNYEQLEPLVEVSEPLAAPPPMAMRLASLSAGLGGLAAVAAAAYAALVVAHWTAWWMFAICLVLVVVGLVTFVFFQRQDVQHRTNASDAWGYAGLAANLVSLMVVASTAVLASVIAPALADRPVRRQPPIAGNPWPTGPNGPALRKEEPEPAFKPRWRPFQVPSDSPPDWIVNRPEAMPIARRNLLQWTGEENGFRIKSLRMLPAFAAKSKGNHVAWSPDWQRLYILGSDDYLYEIAVGDWTVRRRLRIWPASQSLYYGKNWLVLGRQTPGSGSTNFQVLIVDPETLAPAAQLDLPAAFRIRAVVGSAGSKYLFAADQAGQTLTAIDLEAVGRGKGERKAPMTPMPISSESNYRGPHELRVTPDGKLVFCRERNVLAVVALRNGSFFFNRLRPPDQDSDEVHVSAHPQRLIYKIEAGSGSARSCWKIYDTANFQDPIATLPAGLHCSFPDVDPVSGDILKADNRLFSVLDGSGTVKKSLGLDKAIQRAGETSRDPTFSRVEWHVSRIPGAIAVWFTGPAGPSGWSGATTASRPARRKKTQRSPRPRRGAEDTSTGESITVLLTLRVRAFIMAEVDEYVGNPDTY